MKNTVIIIFSVLLFSAMPVLSQTNKPDNAFGIGYGISFANNTTHGIRFSHWTKKNIEYGGEISFNYNATNSSTKDSVETDISAFPFYTTFLRETITIEKYFNVSAAPFAVYHFNVPGNLDVYAGFSLPFGVAANGDRNTAIIIDEANFYRKTESNIASPFTYRIGLFLRAGSNFFFYKNLALGASFNLGFISSQTKGMQQEKVTHINSGTNNPYSGTTTQLHSSNDISISQNSFGFSGSAIFSLTYYFSCKNKAE